MKKIIFILTIFLVLLPAVIAGQGFANVKVNHIKAGDQNTDGGNSIAISGNTLYILWADFESTYFSYVSKSTDGGISFADGAKAGGVDPHVFGSITTDISGTIYVAWDGIAGENISGVYFAKSTDNANSFSLPLTISADGVFPQIAVNGSSVYIFYIMVKPDGKMGYFFSRSLNGGISFEAPYEVSTASFDNLKFDAPCSMTLDNSGNIYCAWNDGRRTGTGTDIYVAKSTNGGASFGTNIMANDASGNENKIKTGPSIAAKGSDVYLTWRQEDDEQGSNRKIFFSKSTDGGTSFSADKLIAQGGWGSPALTLNASGDIYLAYPQYTAEQNGLFCAKSNDGGESFPVTVFISSANAEARNISIAVDANDILYAVWTDNRSGSEGVYFAKGEITITEISENIIPTEFVLQQNYPNPFNPETTIEYSIPSVEKFHATSLRVNLKIYDALGRVVATLINGEKSPGNYSVKFDGSKLPSGIYFCRMKAGSFSKTLKMVLMK